MFNLYENIKSLCAERGMTVSAMCERARISKSTMSNLKNGRSDFLSIRTAAKIAAVLGVPVDDVLHGRFPELDDPLTHGANSPLSDDAHHIGVLYDRADEKDKVLAHSVLDKYETEAKIVPITSKGRNPGGFVELDVYDEPAAAGLGNYLDAPKCHREQHPSFIVPKGTTFGIRISGNSMEPMIHDGMTVFVKQTITVDSGKVGIFVLNGSSFCKQLIVDHAKKEVRLHSLNPDYEDIVVTPADDLRTIGQVL
jgi:SOS-response transcriptional repressor LexA/DNA-binding Xre family transcriptional regulator